MSIETGRPTPLGPKYPPNMATKCPAMSTGMRVEIPPHGKPILKISSGVKTSFSLPSTVTEINKVDDAAGRMAKLTKQELKVFHMVKRNKTNDQIVETMFMNKRTVEGHVSRLRSLLQIPPLAYL